MIGGIGAFFVYRYIQNERTELEVTEQLFLGDRYLSELDYDAAIAVYEAVIEIDPKNEDAYIGLAEVYVEMGEYEEAVETLEVASTEIESNIFKIQIDSIQEKIEIEEKPSNISEEEERKEEENDGVDSLEMEELTETTYWGDGRYFISSFDNYGRILAEVYFYPDGTEEIRVIYAYNGESFFEVRRSFYYPDGIGDFYIEPLYDKDNRCVGEYWYEPDGSLRWYELYEYDTDGNYVGYTEYNADGTWTHHSLDGTWTYYSLDGTSITFNPDGSVME